jgi:hypothetical protein
MQQALSRRQAFLGPDLLKNPNLGDLAPSGWALNWDRYGSTKVSVAPVTVPRVFSSQNRLKIVGSSQQNIASTARIKLPDNKRRYFFSFFTEVANAGPTGAAEIYLDEFDKDNNWLGGQWLGGFTQRPSACPDISIDRLLSRLTR